MIHYKGFSIEPVRLTIYNQEQKVILTGSHPATLHDAYELIDKHIKMQGKPSYSDVSLSELIETENAKGNPENASDESDRFQDFMDYEDSKNYEL